MENQKSTLGDLINPETRNILEKYKRLYTITLEMGIEKSKCDDLKYLESILPTINHHHKDEAINLVVKLKKIKK